MSAYVEGEGYLYCEAALSLIGPSGPGMRDWEYKITIESNSISVYCSEIILTCQ